MAAIDLPEYGRHIVFLGSTGSGKSTLAEAMLKYYSNQFVIDTQDSLTVNSDKKIDSPKGIKNILKKYNIIHYVPKLEYRTRDVWNYIFKSLNETSTKRKPLKRIIYIDEIFHLGYGISFPDWITKSITTARQKQISFWVSTQRPKCIPGAILSEASKIYVFYLSKYDDMKLISTFCRTNPKELLDDLQNQQDDFSFIEIDVRKGTYKKFKKLAS